MGLGLLHGFTGDGLRPLVWLHATTAYLLLGALPLLFLALVRKKPVEIGLCTLTLLLWAWFNRPPLSFGGVDSEPALRVVSANTLMVNPSPEALVEEVLGYQADVLLFQEFTPAIRSAMEGSDYPYRLEHPAQHSFGIGLYSRYPITSERLIQIGGVDWQRVVLAVDGRSVEVWNVHTLPPVSARYHRDWLGQIAVVAAEARKVQGPLVVAGDFNLTRHHQGYAQLTEVLVDAHRDCGRWVASTWPAGGFLFGGGPEIKLDYVFLGGGVRCSRIAEGIGVGSDHRPLIADVVLPR